MIVIEDPNMVMVEWEDSEMTEGWKSKPELLEYLNESISIVQSVGWLLLNDENYTVIAQSIDREHASGFLAGDLIKIPKSLVKSVVELKGFPASVEIDADEYIVTPGSGEYEQVHDALMKARDMKRHHEIVRHHEIMPDGSVQPKASEKD